MNRLRVYLSFVRFSHSVFALPFALSGALLAARQTSVGWMTIVWILVAMVSARSAAMGFNRLVDARLDALNPRTANRELPRGAMRQGEAIVFVVASSALFIASAWALNPLCFWLSPVALAIVFWYSLAKRFTTWTQLFLGLAMAVAPVGGWLAAGGRDGWEPWLLGAAIGTWVAGFDVLYACQDLDFDRGHGLRSIPVRFALSVRGAGNYWRERRHLRDAHACRASDPRRVGRAHRLGLWPPPVARRTRRRCGCRADGGVSGPEVRIGR